MPGAEVIARTAALAAALLAAVPAVHADTPGDFDFYVLSLSWSPSWCEAEGDEDHPQCDGRRPYAFVVHGLWPQYERGWPEFCQTRDGPSRREVDAMTDIMPSQGLVRHQWRKHGSCSGLEPDAYFETIRQARSQIRVPPALERLDRYVMVDPDAVEAAFRQANPDLPADGIAVTCDGRRLREVRICLTTGLRFRDCREIDRKACERDSVVMPPVR